MITGTPFNQDTHSMQIRGPHVADAHVQLSTQEINNLLAYVAVLPGGDQ